MRKRRTNQLFLFVHWTYKVSIQSFEGIVKLIDKDWGFEFKISWNIV
jgi:hypothetical protein